MLAVLLLSGCSAPAFAQHPAARSFGIEWAGGTIGSGVGVALGVALVRPDACDSEDVACILERLGSIGLITAVTAPAGTYALGRALDTRPHAAGALIGGLVGAAAGVGAIRLLDETGVRAQGVSAVLVYTISQGLISAVGSRLGAALRD